MMTPKHLWSSAPRSEEQQGITYSVQHRKHLLPAECYWMWLFTTNLTFSSDSACCLQTHSDSDCLKPSEIEWKCHCLGWLLSRECIKEKLAAWKTPVPLWGGEALQQHSKMENSYAKAGILEKVNVKCQKHTVRVWFTSNKSELSEKALNWYLQISDVHNRKKLYFVSEWKSVLLISLVSNLHNCSRSNKAQSSSWKPSVYSSELHSIWTEQPPADLRKWTVCSAHAFLLLWRFL